MDHITFECANCRQILKVGADKAGKPAKCPRCATQLQIPSHSTAEIDPPPPPPRPAARNTDDEIVDIQPTAPRQRDRDTAFDDERPRRRRDAGDDDDDRPRRKRRDEEDDDDDDRPRKRRLRDEDDDDDRPRKRRRDEDDDYDDRPRKKAAGFKPMDRWPKVQVGILICAIAACVMTGAWAIYLISDLLALIGFISLKSGAQAGIGWLNTAVTFLKIGVIIGLLGSIGGMVGYVFNVFVPNKRGALGIAITVISVGAVEIILFIIFQMLPVFRGLPMGPLGGGQVVNFIFSLIWCLVFGAVYILLYLLMSNICHQWKQRGQGRDCVNLVVLVGVGAGLLLFGGIMTYIAGSSRSEAMLWVGLVLKLLADISLVIVFAWSIPVLFRTKDVID